MIEIKSYNLQNGLCEKKPTPYKYFLKVQECDDSIA